MLQAVTEKTRGRHRPQDVDRRVGARIRERRVMLGFSQQTLADEIGVTYQQALKYENGINRVSAGRLHSIAMALGVEPGWFFADLDKPKLTSDERATLSLVEDYRACTMEHRTAIRTLARALRP